MPEDIIELSLPCDFHKNIALEDTAFEISTNSREDWDESGQPSHVLTDIFCYTDGAMNKDKYGGSYIIMYDGEWLHGVIPLGNQSTLFQAEIVSINHAASEIMQTWNENRCVFIHS